VVDQRGLGVGAADRLVMGLPRMIGGNGSEAGSKAITLPISRSNMVVTVTDNGDVESRSNTDVKCAFPRKYDYLDRRGWNGRGRRDVIVRLDDSKIEESLDLQKIAYTKALATKIQAEQESSRPKLPLQEYEEGTFSMMCRTLRRRSSWLKKICAARRTCGSIRNGWLARAM